MKKVFRGDSLEMIKVSLPKDQLDGLDIGNQTVGDLVALAVGKVGENLSARQVTHMGVAPNSHLETYIHLAGSDVEVDGCRMGKYAVLLDLSQDSDVTEDVTPLKTVAKELCQHILGLKPSTVGDFENDKPLDDSGDDKPLADADETSLSDKDNEHSDDSDSSDDESDDSDDEKEEEGKKSSKVKMQETRLVFQEFLFNPEVVVGEYLQDNKAIVNKFLFVECGQKLPSDSE